MRAKSEELIRTLLTGFVTETLGHSFVSKKQTQKKVIFPLGCSMILYHRIGKMYRKLHTGFYINIFRLEMCQCTDLVRNSTNRGYCTLNREVYKILGRYWLRRVITFIFHIFFMEDAKVSRLRESI